MRVPLVAALAIGLGALLLIGIWGDRAEVAPGDLSNERAVGALSMAQESSGEELASQKTASVPSRMLNMEKAAASRLTPFNESVTYAQLQQQVAQLDDPVARGLYLQLAGEECAGRALIGEAMAAVRARKRRAMTPAQLQSDDVVDAYFQKFCADFADYDLSGYAELLKESPGSDVAAALGAYDLFYDEDNTDASDKETVLSEAQRIIFTTMDPLALEPAARLLIQNHWDFGRQQLGINTDGGMLAQAQWVAVQMLRCELGGGCGAQQWYTMQACRQYQVCSAGITLVQVWQLTLSPLAYQYAWILHEQLLRARARPYP